MKPSAPHQRCERARSWAALAPDGEISELEKTLLHSHLARCGSCSSFAADVAEIAAALRAASFEPPPRPIAVTTWRRRRVLARLRTVGAAAAVAVMALGIASHAPLANDERKPAELSRVPDVSGDQAELLLLRKERLEAIAAAVAEVPARHFRNQPA